jgi:hypothetical protein
MGTNSVAGKHEGTGRSDLHVDGRPAEMDLVPLTATGVV